MCRRAGGGYTHPSTDRGMEGCTTRAGNTAIAAVAGEGGLTLFRRRRRAAAEWGGIQGIPPPILRQPILFKKVDVHPMSGFSSYESFVGECLVL